MKILNRTAAAVYKRFHKVFKAYVIHLAVIFKRCRNYGAYSFNIRHFIFPPCTAYM